MSTVYEWDQNCDSIYQPLFNSFKSVNDTSAHLEHDVNPANTQQLFDYYRKWHEIREEYLSSLREAISRCDTIYALSEQGYGVSTALAEALSQLLSREAVWCDSALKYSFSIQLPNLEQYVRIPESQVRALNSRYILESLSKLLSIPCPLEPAEQPVQANLFENFFNNFSKIPLSANSAILLKMFLSVAESSDTVMTGLIGEVNVDPEQQIKLLASRNLRELFYSLCSNIEEFGKIDLDFICHIHYMLTRDLDSSHTWRAGEIRREDFYNRSGLTYEYGNFYRGIEELKAFLESADWNCMEPDRFICQAATLYYMLISIHPFLDSNGRTAKTMINFLLLKRGILPILFNTPQEIFALHRYGGSIEDMVNYFVKRINLSIVSYYADCERLGRMGILHSEFTNSDFDAGIYFSIVDNELLKLDFKVYELKGELSHKSFYTARSLISCDFEFHPESLTLLAGLTDTPSEEWQETQEYGISSISYLGTDIYGAEIYEVSILIPIVEQLWHAIFFEATVVLDGVWYNNKGLNYRYLLPV